MNHNQDNSSIKPEGAPRRGLRALLRPRVWIPALALLAAGVAYLLVAGSGGGARGDARKGDAGRPTPVRVALAKTEDLQIYLGALGTVTPLNVVTVRSRVDGQLMSLNFREGQTVKAGELLGQIDPRPFEVQVTQAEGQLARDQALLANARVDLARYRTLLAEDSIPKQQLDTQEALVRQYEGTVEADRGALDNAKLQLAYTRIAAPVSGRLGLRQVDPGNMIHATDTNGLVVLTQEQPTNVVFAIPEQNLPAVLRRMKSGERIAVEAWDREGKTKIATGTLLTVDNQIDTTTGTVKLKAQFANADAALFPNQFVNVRMGVDTLRAATVIPVAAVQRGTPGTFVYVMKPDRHVSVRPVKLGPAEGERVAIASGLAAGDAVVVDGTDRLREDALVEPIADNGAAPAEAPRREGGKGGRKNSGKE